MTNGEEPSTIDHRPSTLPRLYAILDASCFSDDRALFHFAEDLLAGGVTLLQYRNKVGTARQMLSHARELRRIAGDRARLIMNDRADLCLAADFDGVHLGQDDLSPEAARRILTCDQGRPLAHPERGRKAESKERPRNRLWVGVSTHNPEQLAAAEQTGADYLAIGPVFATTSKSNPDPVVGLDGVCAARALTRKPLVAIGGITRANARSVIDAGADAVAVISDLLVQPRRAAADFLTILS